MSDLDQLANKIWDYMKLNQKLEQADLILVLGSSDTRVAEESVRLFKEGFSSLILFTGGYGSITKSIWQKAEAEKFAEIAISLEIPEDYILVENNASNTGENILFSFELLKEKKLNPQKIIVVTKPYMERRTYATFKKQWPNHLTEIIITSPNISFEDYPNEDLTKELVINIMIGDLQRIKEYPKLGFQIEQEIPEDVWNCYKKLIKLGYTKHLINN